MDGHEIEVLDSMLPNLTLKARQGDVAYVDRVVAILKLRLEYRRQRMAEMD